MSRAWGFNTIIYKAPTPISNIARQRPSPGFSEVKEGLKWADTMAIAENVYLFAASEGLATGIRALVDKPPLAKALILSESQSIIMAQCVGFPKK